jgi:hypothetical protein
MAHPGGRPSIYTPKLAKTICTRIAKGESVRAICRDEDMPDADTIYSWLLDETKKEFTEQYTQARAVQAELLFEELFELADESVSDIVGDDKSDGARVQARKLQVDTRKWSLSKMLPKKYGDKLDLTSLGDKLPTPIIPYVSRDISNEKDTEAPQEG